MIVIAGTIATLGLVLWLHRKDCRMNHLFVINQATQDRGMQGYVDSYTSVEDATLAVLDREAPYETYHLAREDASGALVWTHTWLRDRKRFYEEAPTTE